MTVPPDSDGVRRRLGRIKQALILDQDSPWALAEMARMLDEKGLADRALQFISQAVRLDPDNEEYRRLHEEVLEHRKK